MVDMYIIPHKRIKSKNRKNKNDVYYDGTINSKPSDKPYKSDDIRL